jgi:hypothetical protein
MIPYNLRDEIFNRWDVADSSQYNKPPKKSVITFLRDPDDENYEFFLT